MAEDLGKMGRAGSHIKSSLHRPVLNSLLSSFAYYPTGTPAGNAPSRLNHLTIQPELISDFNSKKIQISHLKCPDVLT
jgi:hypothetical protein